MHQNVWHEETEDKYKTYMKGVGRNQKKGGKKKPPTTKKTKPKPKTRKKTTQVCIMQRGEAAFHVLHWSFKTDNALEIVK